jgi:hypothetical protein
MLCNTCQYPNYCITLKRCLIRTGTQSALDKQVSGSHYKDKAIQPIIYIHANNLGFCEGNVVKYVTRWKEKNGIADLEKAKHYIELLIEMENAGK